MSRYRGGFTLTEVLIALMIFSIISTAMVGTLMMGTRLFREGEMARAANDEAMSAMALLERDVERAYPYAQFGDLYASLPSYDHPDCVVGWTIANPDPEDALHRSRVFVLWGKDRQGALRRAELDDYTVLDTNGNGDPRDDDPYPHLASGDVVSDRCRHFGVYLAGTAPAGTPADEVMVAPEKGSWWQVLESTSGTIDAAPPHRGTTADPLAGAYATTVADLPNDIYPSAIRFVLLMEGKGGTAKRGVVTSDQGDDAVTIAGIQGLPTTRGNVLLIDHPPPDSAGPYPGYEIISYESAIGGRLAITQDRGQELTAGPLNYGNPSNPKPGRAVYRSTKSTETSIVGNQVHACRIFTLTKSMPH